MKNITTTLLCLFSTSLVFGQTAEPGNSEIRQAIEEVNGQFSAAFARGDAAAIGLLYRQEAQLMPPEAENIRGRAAIQKYWQETIDSGLEGLDLKSSEVYGGSGSETAVEVGEYTVAAPAGKVVDRGKYIVLWQRVNGQWRLHRDMFSSNSAPPKRSPAPQS